MNDITDEFLGTGLGWLLLDAAERDIKEAQAHFHNPDVAVVYVDHRHDLGTISVWVCKRLMLKDLFAEKGLDFPGALTILGQAPPPGRRPIVVLSGGTTYSILLKVEGEPAKEAMS